MKLSLRKWFLLLSVLLSVFSFSVQVSALQLPLPETQIESPVVKRSGKNLPHYQQLKSQLSTSQFFIALLESTLNQVQHAKSISDHLNLIEHNKLFDNTQQTLKSLAPALLPRSIDIISQG